MTTRKARVSRPVDGLVRKPVRKCQTIHECCVCRLMIHLGDHYYDGGYGRRAHVNCLANAERQGRREATYPERSGSQED